MELNERGFRGIPASPRHAVSRVCHSYANTPTCLECNTLSNKQPNLATTHEERNCPKSTGNPPFLRPRACARIEAPRLLPLEPLGPQRGLVPQHHILVEAERQRETLRLTRPPHAYRRLENRQHSLHELHVVAAVDVGLEAGVAAARLGRDVDGVEPVRRQPVHRVPARLEQVRVHPRPGVQRANAALLLRLTPCRRSHRHALRRLRAVVEELRRYLRSHVIHHHVEEAALQSALAEHRRCVDTGRPGMISPLHVSENSSAISRAAGEAASAPAEREVHPLAAAGAKVTRAGVDRRRGEKKHVIARGQAQRRAALVGEKGAKEGFLRVSVLSSPYGILPVAVRVELLVRE